MLIIFIIIYSVSVYYNYNWIQKAYYHQKGKFRYFKPAYIDILFVICPLLNILISIFMFFDDWKHKDYKDKITFFEPNKPFKD